jgi:signal transduction histidine kinase
MHDELGQSLSGLRRMLSRVETGRFDTIRQDCLEIVDEVLQNVRKLSQVLRPVILDDFGLDSGLRWLCERSTQRTGIPVHYTSNTQDRFTEGIETHLFRITQEALTNIARHSEAKEAWVDLQVSGNRIRLSIQDNGKGFQDRPQAPSPSLGMVGMRARARHLNGELVVENRKEGGLSIRVETPLQQEEQISRNELRTEPEDSSVVG